MVNKKTIGKAQIGVGVFIIVLGIVIAGFAYKFISEKNNPLFETMGGNWQDIAEFSGNFEGYSNESITQLTSTFFVGATNAMSSIYQLRIILMLSELIILSISISLILQGLANIAEK